ncbi:trypsin-like peptidase domain-containing protein [Streptomyces sp. NRRL S-87]|uniref:VMAP-C domain-containing protein n=1 Tax=Streptomyces sp. NRRL S-87 TaxID=1463920 RepID=UPI0004C1F09B|nr:trypsin-like peptidase domain-containing protein [Streptomyces sp. NRRL S-87]
MTYGRTAGSARAFEILEPLVTAATVRVHAPPPGYEPDEYGAPGAGDIWGSGFFVAPGWVLTCAHVVGEGGGGAVRTVGREVGITFAPGVGPATGTVAGRVECVLPEVPVPAGGMWPAPDLALVRVLDPVDHACVWLTDRPRVNRFADVAYFGCTDDTGRPEITGRPTRLRGDLGGSAMVRLGADDEVDPGMSGGPVVDLERGEVVGVVKARRNDRGGGLAVSVTQLRTLPSTAKTGLYRRVLRAHDRYHHDQHQSDQNTRPTWTDAHTRLQDGAAGEPVGRCLTAAERTTLTGLLAELPPPASSEAVQRLVADVLGEDWTGLGMAPLTWRDGLGMLYDPAGERSEAAVMLRYATDVSVAEHRETPLSGADEDLWDWVRATAAGGRFWRGLRKDLGDRREAGLAARRHGGQAPPAGAPLPGAAGALPPGPSVLLEVWSHGWEEAYDWRVSVLLGPEHTAPIGSGVRATRDGLPDAVRAPLAEAFRRCDTTGAAALLEAAVAPELFGLAVDEWMVAGGVPVGVQRPVVLRWPGGTGEDGWPDGPGGGRPGGTGTGGEDFRRMAARWARVMAGPVQEARADCRGGRPRTPPYAWLGALPENTVPAHCRMGGLHAVQRAGFGVVLCRRPPAGGGSCAPFHRGVKEELAEAVRGDALPVRLQALRGRAYGRDPDAYWATGLGLVWDDPRRPLPTVDPLQGDL